MRATLTNSANGDDVHDRIVVIAGQSVADGALSPQSVAMRVNDTGLDTLEPLVGDLAASQLDLATLLPPGTVLADECFINVIGCWGSAQVKIAKNRLAKIALDGSEAASIAPLLKGPTLIAYSKADPVAAPKVATDFAKANEKFVILGGAMGKTALDVNGVKQLASLPSLDELRGKIVGLIQAPATKIAQVINAPAAKVARVVQAYASKDAA